jgi:Lrp/AsnC family leucine-responsive transcriptional regulator
MDSIDLKILDLLQNDGRIKRNVLAEKVGLSLPSLSERIKKLEEQDYIEGYYAKLNRPKLGYDIMAFIQVLTESSKNYERLTDKAVNTPEILECHSVLGEGSHILKVITKSRTDLEQLLAKIQSWPGVVRTITSFVLSTNKETTTINLNIKE